MPLISAALARRLVEPDGPEVILVGAERSPSRFDQATLDRTWMNSIETPKRAGKCGRLQA